MKILVAVDSFKGSASSKDLNNAIKKSIEFFDNIEEVKTFPISDGGEGFLDSIKNVYKSTEIIINTVDLFGNPYISSYIIIEKNNEKIAVIESAKVIGIHLSNCCPEDLLNSSSYGLGLMIQDAIKKKVNKVLVGLGGTGTIDGGLGILESLDYSSATFNNSNPLLKETNQCLKNLNLKKFPIPVIGVSDVNNPYSGIHGAAYIFGNQKGATSDLITILNQKMESVRRNIIKETNVDINQIEGSGSAGGIGGILSIIGDKIISASTFIEEYLNLENTIQNVDLVITGEGKMDNQTFFGKAPYIICKLAEKNYIPAIIICGNNSVNYDKTYCKNKYPIFCIQQQPISVEEALNKDVTLKNIGILSRNLLNFWLLSSCNKNGSSSNCVGGNVNE